MSNETKKTFSITCEKNIQCFAYDIDKLNNCNLNRLDTFDEILDCDSYKRNFCLKNTIQDENDILIVTMKNQNISINRYILNEKKLQVQKNISKFSYEVIVPKGNTQIEIPYSNNNENSICVFDVEKNQKVIPGYSYNKWEKQLKGKFKLNANQKYIILNFNK